MSHASANAKPTPTPLSNSALKSPTGESFSLAQARSIVGDYFRPKPWIYWTDFLVSWTLAMIAFRFVLDPPAIGASWFTLPVRGVMFLISSLLLYRSGLFIHELMHLPEEKFDTFRKVWNSLCGVPFLIPSFVYLTHIDHHRRKHYGTQADGEYLPLSNRSPWHIVFYLAQSFVIPILAVIRFGILTPLTWFHGPLRNWVLRHASSMIIDPTYLRPLPTEKTMRLVRRQEVLTFLFIVIFGTLIYRGAFHNGVVNPWVLVQAYCTGVFVIIINALRTLGAHRWLNDSGDAVKKDESQMTFVEQMLDSVNYDAGFLPSIWAPLGLRYHALHHIFPSMPYHAMAKAHHRLMRDLPKESPYRRTVSPSLWAELAALWNRAAASTRRAKPQSTAAA